MCMQQDGLIRDGDGDILVGGAPDKGLRAIFRPDALVVEDLGLLRRC